MSDRTRLHLIGVGGSGMLPLALLLRQAGHPVTGSDDLCAPARLDLLHAQGISVLSGADPALARAADCVVASPAIPETHVERRAARRAGLPVKSRARALAEVIADRQTICVAGSHGKSTVTAMLVHILSAAGQEDFGYMLGAAFADAARLPARLGAPGAPFVTEACEAHGALAAWQPSQAILTNLDDEHADHYGGLPGLRRAVADFLSRLPPEGRAVACGDDPQVLDLLRRARCAALTYGLGADNDLRAVPDGTGGATVFLDGTDLGRLSLIVPGRHNLLNALAALGMALTLGIGFATAAGALADFPGLARRLQPVAPGNRLRLFDDFAHHPAEIEAALAVLRETTEGRLIAIFEPQLHSRITRMAARFVQALGAADHSYLLPVVALGEPLQAGNGDAAVAEACRAGGLSCHHVSDMSELLARLQADLQGDETLVVMAGGSGAAIAPRIAQALSHPPGPRAVAAPNILIGERRPPPPDLLTLVAAQARRRPRAPAVEMGHRRLSYADLVQRSDDLAASLAAAGVGAGDSVGVCLGRTVDRVTAFLATLQLGGVFVPLDPALPEERLRQMLDTAAVRTVVVNAASPALPDIGLRIVPCGPLPERGEAAAPQWQPQPPAAGAPAYMIFTSGTTGEPKAVEISRGGLANYAAAAVRHFEITAEARVSLLSGFGFDVSVGDMAMALAAGACLVCPSDLQAIPGPPVGRFIAEARLTHLSLTPSALAIIPPAEHPQLTHVIVAGEACPPALVERWGKGRVFLNAYGPTEATVEALFARCTPGQPVRIGRPIDNMGACLMTRSLTLAAPGEEGELCLFGPGLATGYRHQPGLSAQHFPVVDLPGLGPTRIYRTGDRARLGADGGFVYLGRLDSQLKVNGHRLEPGEVEAALCSLPGVIDAAVSRLATPQGADRLIAHLVMAPGAPAPDPVALRMRLAQQLPSWMVPSVFLPVPEIPRNSNGKRDRSALPVPPQLTRPATARSTGTATEAQLMALIDREFGTGIVTGTRDSLHAAGLDSLSMANLLFAIEAAFGITLDAGFEAGLDTVEVLGLMVDARRKAPPAASAPGIENALAARILPYLATWPGRRLGRAGLVRSLCDAGPLPQLFWCFQTGKELSRLTECLNGAVSLYGLRSGHLAVDYNAETLAAFGRLYADEIAAIAPTGPLYLGGNCQGGLVIREAGQELMRRGRDVALTILMEQGRFLHYPGVTLLLFGAGSYLNPYGQMAAPEQVFRQAYPAGHHVEILPGAHGQYFTPGNAEVLAATILRHLDRHRSAPALPPTCHEARFARRDAG